MAESMPLKPPSCKEGAAGPCLSAVGIGAVGLSSSCARHKRGHGVCDERDKCIAWVMTRIDIVSEFCMAYQ